MDERAIERIGIGDVVHRKRRALTDRQIRRGIARKFSPLADDEDRRHDAAILEMSRDSQTIAAVRAGAAENRYALTVRVMLENRVDHRHRRVFHQQQRRNCETIGRPAIDASSLFGAENLHNQ